MESEMQVILYEKAADGELKQIDDRVWNSSMIASLEHVNYVTVGGVEYETVEGRLNLDTGRLEVLVVRMQNS